MNNINIISILIIASGCSASAHLLFKKISEYGWMGLLSWQGALAFMFYGLGFLVYFYSLKYVKMNIACQFAALTYILICLGAYVFFHETVSTKQIAGMVGVIGGLLLVLGGS